MIKVAFVFLLFFLFSCKKTEVWNGNILIITMDTTRADHIGAYGYKNGKTPNIDKLIKNGIMFTNCYSAAPLTLPSHSTIFTGKYPIKHGVRNNGRYRLPDSVETMAELFKKTGFNTYAVISSFVLLSKFGLVRGFNIFDDSLNSHNAINTFKSQISAKEVYGKFSSWFNDNWDSRFFAWIHLYDPHSPYIYHIENQETDRSDIISLYDGEITFMDKYIGMIIDDLDKKGILDKTIIVLIGDHGEAFGEHVESGSHMIFCYQENIKVPFIFYNKHLFNKSIVINSSVSSVDLMPTILKLSGIESDIDMDGVDLTPLINGGKGEMNRIIYFESMYGKEELNWAPLTGIIMDKYKYISLPKPELYDLSADPKERNNLYIKMKSKCVSYDKELKKTVSILSGNIKNAKRNLDKVDLNKLKSLGYISSFSVKSNKSIDPKDGIILNTKLKRISSEFLKKDPNILEKELEEIRKSKIGESNFLVYNLLYKLYLRKKDKKKIILTLKTAKKMLPYSVPIKSIYAEYLKNLRRFNESISECKSILKIDPMNTRTYILLAEIYEKLGDINLRDFNLDKAISLEPQNISLKIMFAEKLIKRKEFKKAVTIYNSITSLSDVQNNVSLLFKIAMFNTKYGSLITASELFEKIETKNPGGKYYFFHALILSKIERIPEAIEKMKIALEKFEDQLSDREKKIAENEIQKWTGMR